MDADEIKRYVEFGKYDGVCVDCKKLIEYPGFVRVIVFKRNNRVSIEFYALIYDAHSTFPEYCCDFQTVDEAIESIENFLGKPIAEWVNYNKSGEYPVYVDDKESEPSEESFRRLERDAIDKRIVLPQKGNFKLNLSCHFLDEVSYKAFIEEVKTNKDLEIYKQATITYGTST